MKMRAGMGVAILAAIAGQAMGQATIDGRLSGDESFYGPILFVQNTPTSFGDNNPANVPPSGNALSATQGVEIAIPLSAIGGSGSFRLAGWITSGDHTFMSNQVIGGLPNLGNLGGTSTSPASPGSSGSTSTPPPSAPPPRSTAPSTPPSTARTRTAGPRATSRASATR
ncbi:MAG: hypothetical protein H6809_04585 [Phycisphaeraceae bacterium]|nr:hypothetical protein [Phycisphaeraceae bacterium]